jgi:hypothetical protein
LSSTSLWAIRFVGIHFHITIAIRVLATTVTGTIETIGTIEAIGIAAITMIAVGAIVGGA